jgi:hypothetical protein
MGRKIKVKGQTGQPGTEGMFEKWSMGGGSSSKRFSKSNKIKEVQTKPKKSLQNQKRNKNVKISESDAIRFNQPTGQGVTLGARARAELEKKYPVAAKITEKAKKPKNFRIKPKGTDKANYKDQYGNWLDT